MSFTPPLWVRITLAGFTSRNKSLPGSSWRYKRPSARERPARTVPAAEKCRRLSIASRLSPSTYSRSRMPSPPCLQNVPYPGYSGWSSLSRTWASLSSISARALTLQAYLFPLSVSSTQYTSEKAPCPKSLRRTSPRPASTALSRYRSLPLRSSFSYSICKPPS